MLSSDAEVFWVARYDYKDGWVLKEHQHNYYQMIYIIDGCGEFILDSEVFKITANMLYFIRPDTMHGLKVSKGAFLKTLDIKFVIYNTELSDKLDTIFGNIVEVSSEVRGLLEKIREEGKVKRHLYQNFSVLYLMQILFYLLRKNEGYYIEDHKIVKDALPLESAPAYNKVVEYIKIHYAEELTLKSIATFLGYDQSYICQSFKKEIKCTTMQFLNQYRIEKAKELITYSDYSLKQISDMVGFKSIHHFSRLFCQFTGMPPGEWRYTEKEGICKDVYFKENFKNKSFVAKVE